MRKQNVQVFTLASIVVLDKLDKRAAPSMAAQCKILSDGVIRMDSNFFMCFYCDYLLAQVLVDEASDEAK